MLDYETDKDAHFECPQCGQKGSVPKATIEKALAETPHVYISCSNCTHKFEPFAPVEELAGEEPEEPAEPQTGPSPPPSPLEEHWAQHDDDADADTEEAEGNLPGWMMPVEKPPSEMQGDTQAETGDTADTSAEDTAAEDTAADNSSPQNVAQDDASQNDDAPQETHASEDTSVQEAESDPVAAVETSLDEAIAEEMAADSATDELTDTPTEESADNIADHVIEDATHELGEELTDGIEAINDVEPEATVSEEPQSLESIVPPEPAPSSEVIEAPIADLANDAVATPDASHYDAASVIDTTPERGPTGVLNRLLVGLALVLLVTGAYIFSNGQNMPPSALGPDTASSSAVELKNANFVRFTEDGQAGIEVSINFNNPSAQIGIIGDFRIELQNEAGERLVHWTILSTGETVAPGRDRTLTSILFGPPQGLAYVNIVYPLEE